jgi:hypothetical protein
LLYAEKKMREKKIVSTKMEESFDDQQNIVSSCSISQGKIFYYSVTLLT